MKILHVLYSGLGGHGNVFFSFVAGNTEGKFQYEAVFNGIEEVRDEYVQNCSRYSIPWKFVAKRPGPDIKYYSNLTDEIRSSEADIIFLHSSAYIFPAWMGAALSKKKKRILVRETQANHLKSKMEWWWLGVALILADDIVFLSEEYRQEIKKRLSLFYRDKKVHVVPNGIDLSMYKRDRAATAGTVTIGMQSRIVPIKDHKTLLKAFALLLQEEHEIKLLLKIAGDGECKKELIQLSRSLGIEASVEFTGMLGEPQLIEFLHSLDIYVHASFGETMSTAIMQAMACSLPIIASDVKGISNMIQHNQTGFLVPARDVQAMYSAVKRLIHDTEGRAVMGQQAYLYAENNFSYSKMMSSYKKIFLVRKQ